MESSNHESKTPENRPGGLESALVDVLRRRHYWRETEAMYVSWYRRFVRFHRYRHPREMGATEVESFLTHLARDKGVAPSTQNQALCGLVFFFDMHRM